MRIMRIFLAFSVVLLLLGAGCSITTPDKPKVAATIFPVYDLVRIIGGEDVQTVLIVPPGASPHTFEPTPSLIKELKGTSRIFQIGHGLDNWTETISESIPKATMVTMDKNVELYTATEHEDEELDHGHDKYDPHYWMDPTNAYIMVDTIAAELSVISPEHKTEFVERAEKFKDELERKDYDWQKRMLEIQNPNIVTFHDAFAYFAKHFQLDLVATFEPFPGREPTPQYLIDLKNEISKHKVKTLYVEPQFPSSALETFAKDNGLTIATLDPEGSADHTTYLDMIEYNVATLIENQK